MADRLDEQWTRRDFPVLVASAAAVDENFSRPFQASQLEVDGVAEDDVVRALLALDGSHLELNIHRSMGPTQPTVIVRGLTERGRRAVGLWPADDSGPALLGAILAAADASTDDEERGKLRRAAEALGGVTKATLTGVAVAVATKQITGG